ncbi:hypothetical protein ACFWRZ_21375 [Streptomyces rubiginosohelvolus]|uniref:hypothetical protein n=1 Tax=Streptomyces rubiginosohelvolus TaxID=67362 RepID=UPI0036471472
MLVARKWRGLGPITKSSARRPEVSAAGITWSLKGLGLAHGVRAAPTSELELRDALVCLQVARAARVVACAEGRADGNAFFIPEDVGQDEEDAAGVDQVVDPAQALAGRER